jgi:hypothetical protein
LVFIQVKHGCSILSIRRVRINHRLPLLQDSFIADLAWVIFNENAFSVILHFRIIWTRFDPTRIADNATVNATHRLEFRLWPPKSPARNNSYLRVWTGHQRDFRANSAHRQSTTRREMHSCKKSSSICAEERQDYCLDNQSSKHFSEHCQYMTRTSSQDNAMDCRYRQARV